MINEACDQIWVNGKMVEYDDKLYRVFPFFYKEGKLFLGDIGGNHGDLRSDYNIDSKGADFYNDNSVTWILGRIFQLPKVITFWTYPNKLEFNDIISLLEKELNVKIWNNGWKIEVLKETTNKNLRFSGAFPERWLEYLEIFDQIPIEEYEKSKDQPEEFYQQHLLSPMKKKGKPKGWKLKGVKYKMEGETDVEARARLKYMYQEKINEACDQIWVNGEMISYSSKLDRAFPFFYKKGKLLLGDIGESHYALGKMYDIPPSETNVDYYNEKNVWLSGRIYQRPKLITFWTYPTKSEFDEIVSLLAKLQVKIWNNGWKIEVLKETIDKNLTWAYAFPKNWGEYLKIFDQIPVEEYEKSKDQPKEFYQQHILSPTQKKNNKPKNWKPKQVKFKMPGESEIEAKRRLKNMYQEKINEACDEIYPNGKTIEFNKEDTIPFIVYDNSVNDVIIKFGGLKGMHGDIRNRPDGAELYRGRLFLDSKVITFWTYPDKFDFSEILEVIYDNLEWDNINGFKKFNSDWNDWKIEVVKEESMEYYDIQDYYRHDIYEYIPVKLYAGSINPPDEVYQQHLLSPMQKKNNKPKNWKPKQVKFKMPGETEIEAKRRLKNIYQEKLNSKLFESPDSVKEMGLRFTDNDAMPFIVLYNSDVILGEFGEFHSGGGDEWGAEDDLREYEGYFGRLWLNSKLISFWEYPDPNDIEKVIKNMDSALKKDCAEQLDDNFNIWDFNIEVINVKKSILNLLSIDPMEFISLLRGVDDIFTDERFINEVFQDLEISINFCTPGILTDIFSDYDYDKIKNILNYDDSDDIHTGDDKLYNMFDNSDYDDIKIITNLVEETIGEDKFMIEFKKYVDISDLTSSDFDFNYIDLHVLADLIIEYVDENIVDECIDDAVYDQISLVKYAKLKEKPKGASEEQLLLHLQSPIDKKGKAKDRIPGWKPKQNKYKMPGESEIEAKFRLKNMYQENVITKFKLFEVADDININGHVLYYTDTDALPFVIEEDDDRVFIGDAIIGDFGMSHSDSDLRQYTGYFGRLWLNSEIISFWEYPEPFEMEELMEILNKNVNIKLVENNMDKIDIWAYDIEVKVYDEISLENALENDQEGFIDMLFVDGFLTKKNFYSDPDIFNELFEDFDDIIHFCDMNLIVDILSNNINSDDMKRILNSDIIFDNNDSEFEKYDKLFKNINKNDVEDIIDKSIGKNVFINQAKGLVDLTDVDFCDFEKEIDNDILVEFLMKNIDVEEFLERIGEESIMRLIPLVDYANLKEKPKDASEEELLMHLQKPIDKKGKAKDRISGWKPKQNKYKMPGETEIEAKRRLKNMYQENVITKFKLFESPDDICDYDYDYDYDLMYYNSDAHAFGYPKDDQNSENGDFYPSDKMWISDSGGNHEENLPDPEYDDSFSTRHDFNFPGRLWLDSQIMSFWIYPSKTEMVEVIKDLEDELGIKIDKNKWKVEVLSDGSWEEGYTGEVSIVSLNDYVGSANRSEKELNAPHTLSPMQKKNKPQGWKPKQIKFKMSGESEIEAKRRLKNMYQERFLP